MTGPEHYAEHYAAAERLVLAVYSDVRSGVMTDQADIANNLALAQVHATLALAAAPTTKGA
jgi:hypothetical protein